MGLTIQGLPTGVRPPSATSPAAIRASRAAVVCRSGCIARIRRNQRVLGVRSACVSRRAWETRRMDSSWASFLIGGIRTREVDTRPTSSWRYRQDLPPVQEDWLTVIVNPPMSSASSTSTVYRAASALTENQGIALRANLESELAEVRGLGAKLRAEVRVSLQSRRSTNTESEGSEGSALAFEGAQTMAVMEQVSRHADEIVAALTRIDYGTYGICVECGSRIATGRLEARPASALCIECAS